MHLLFIQVGGLLGLWPTLGIVVLTAVIGTLLLRRQGLAEVARLRENGTTESAQPASGGNGAAAPSGEAVAEADRAPRSGEAATPGSQADALAEPAPAGSSNGLSH